MKWETQVFGVESIESALRRAVKTATTRPYGPVYVCLDVADQETEVADEDWMTFGALTETATPGVAAQEDVDRVLVSCRKPAHRSSSSITTTPMPTWVTSTDSSNCESGGPYR